MEASIYLLRSGCSAASAIKTDPITQILNASPSVNAANAVEYGAAYVFPSSESTPSWAVSLSRLWPGLAALDLTSSKSGCVIEIRVNTRVFLISFGLGHLKIDKKLVVHDFGRRAAINGVDPKTVKQVSRQALEGSFIQAIEHAAKSGSVYQFGIDIERDLLQGIFGRCRKNAFGNAIGGATSLRVSVDGNLDTVIARLPIYLRLYSQKIRSSDFLWYERIKVVEDVNEVATLNNALDIHISSYGGADVLLGLPQFLEGVDKICGFRFERGSQRNPPSVYPDPEFHDWVSWCRVKALPLTLSTAEKKLIFADFEGGAELSFSVADCIFWEYSGPGGQVCIRHDGRWFEIDSSFVAGVKSFISALPSPTTSLHSYTGGTEAAYNIALASTIPGSEVLDGKNITLAGAGSAIEPCDVYFYDKSSKFGSLFFVKRKRVGSAGLTHLFSQVLAGVDSFFHRDSSFRSAMNARFINSGVGLGFRPTTTPDASKWTVVVVICDIRRTSRLPFLSQVALKRIIEALRSRYNLTFELTFV